MKRLIYFALMLSVAFIGVFSCKKKDPEPTPRQKILGRWKMTAGSITIGGNTEQVAPCTLDDITEFKTGDVYTIDEGATKCNSSDPQTRSGTYVLNEAGTTLTINDPSIGIGIVFQVLELTNTTLRIKADNVLGLGVNVQYSYQKL
ncbi:MAG: lipocalin family protein [Raineya sp.]|nr:lipocalin family protein [Raineya sp.]MDW8296465.1 lipocalin family protein [Raineya sp.]